jgi:primosomal protein N' (replication factor Y) (superfamily II helicase)
MGAPRSTVPVSDSGRTVQVALPLPHRGTFTYLVPSGSDVPRPGCRVRVPFARREAIGYVVEDPDRIQPEGLRPLHHVLDAKPLFTPEVLDFTRWIADYYLVSWGSVLKCAYPSGLDPEPRSKFRLPDPPPAGPPPEELVPLLEALSSGPRALLALRGRLGQEADALASLAVQLGWAEEETRWASRRRYAGRDRVALLLEMDRALAAAADPGTPAPMAKALGALAAFSTRGFPTVAQVASSAKVPQYVLHEMAEAGWVELFDLLPARLPGRPSPHTLTDAQQAAVEAIGVALSGRVHQTFLLFGITGSGKTEVYLRLMEQAAAEGGTALYLVPEISLASVLARRLLERFGSEVAILHSSMNEHERVRQWRRVASGGARYVIGPRSALFAPLADLRLIVVDEEHDGSYKQQEFPRYHARDMAVLRGMRARIPVVLGSATPSVESFYNATEAGKYTLLELQERTGRAVLPPVEVVDMRAEFTQLGAMTTLSTPLEEALGRALAEGRQAILLRNRLGFSTFVLCRECGRSIQCPSCSVALTFHKRASRLRCHYCGHSEGVPSRCPTCGGEFLQFLGEGTEKVEEVLASKFPGAVVGRMDREAVRTAAAYDALWRDFESGALQILVGTQMVAKGHDVHNVTLVGILGADFLLGMPDFRAAERTFQLVTQAAGRAGRGEAAGHVVLQSCHVDHYAVQASKTHDFRAFYERDIRYRRMVGYPPVGALARVEFRHKEAARAEALSREAGTWLRAQASQGVRILGPTEPPLGRLEGLHRRHILLKAPARQPLRALLSGLLDGPLGRHVGKSAFVEIDPYSLM